MSLSVVRCGYKSQVRLDEESSGLVWLGEVRCVWMWLGEFM